MEDPIVEIMSLCNLVRQTAYQIHVDLGHGYFEKIYENALAHVLAYLKSTRLRHALYRAHKD